MPEIISFLLVIEVCRSDWEIDMASIPNDKTSSGAEPAKSEENEKSANQPTGKILKFKVPNFPQYDIQFFLHHSFTF